MRKINKKADTVKMLNWGTWRIFFLTVMLFIIHLMVSHFFAGNFEIDDLEASIITQRALYAKSGPALVSEYTGRTYPGVLDSAKFSDEQLSEQFLQEEGKYSASFATINPSFEAVMNKKWYERNEPLDSFSQFSSKIYWRYAIIDGQGTALRVKTVDNE